MAGSPTRMGWTGARPFTGRPRAGASEPARHRVLPCLYIVVLLIEPALICVFGCWAEPLASPGLLYFIIYAICKVLEEARGHSCAYCDDWRGREIGAGYPIDSQRQRSDPDQEPITLNVLYAVLSTLHNFVQPIQLPSFVQGTR